MKVDLIRDGTQNTVIAVTITPEDTILFGEHPLHGLDLPTRGSNIIRRLLEIATAVEGGVASAKASREARMARRDLRQAMEAAPQDAGYIDAEIVPPDAGQLNEMEPG